MGAFRGLVVDVLWMRADSLQQEGRYFDAKQLAEWISMLQPRFAKVWDFQAWTVWMWLALYAARGMCL